MCLYLIHKLSCLLTSVESCRLRRQNIPVLNKMIMEVKNAFMIFITRKRAEISQHDRDPQNVKSYLSREAWPYDSFFLWFQGVVYLISPMKTSDLFQAALRTSYMHTDDVFMRICIGKTAELGQKSIELNISSYAAPDAGESLQRYWCRAKTLFLCS